MVFKRNADPNAAYALTPGLLDAMASLAAALDGRQAIDDAITRNSESMTAAQADQAAASATLGELEVALAIEIDAHRAADLEAAVGAARVASDSAAQLIARTTRIREALEAKAREADDLLATVRGDWEAALQDHKGVALRALHAELQEAVKPLLPILARAAALRSQGLMAWSNPLLADLLVPSPSDHNHHIVRGTRTEMTNGEPVDLLESWRRDSTAAALATSFQPVEDLRLRLARHKPFSAQLAKSMVLPEVSATNRAAGEYNRAIDRREQAEFDRLLAKREVNRVAVAAALASPAPSVPIDRNRQAAEFNRPIEEREEAERERRLDAMLTARAHRLAAEEERFRAHQESEGAM